jgi:hypothetical protein
LPQSTYQPAGQNRRYGGFDPSTHALLVTVGHSRPFPGVTGSWRAAGRQRGPSAVHKHARWSPGSGASAEQGCCGQHKSDTNPGVDCIQLFARGQPVIEISEFSRSPILRSLGIPVRSSRCNWGKLSSTEKSATAVLARLRDTSRWRTLARPAISSRSDDSVSGGMLRPRRFLMRSR